MLSAEPEIMYFDSAVSTYRLFPRKDKGKRRAIREALCKMRKEVRAINIYRPDRSVMSFICPQSLAIVGEPHIDDVVFGT